MPGQVPTEVFVIAPKNADGSLPQESKICDDMYFYTVEEAQLAIEEEYPPFLRDKYEVYTAELTITKVADKGEEPDIDQILQEDKAATNQSTDPSQTPVDADYGDMRQAIVDFCQNNRAHLDNQFTVPLNENDYQSTLDTDNWLTTSEQDFTASEDNDFDTTYNAYIFDCEPFDDQLRAYVSVDADGNPTSVQVQGE